MARAGPRHGNRARTPPSRHRPPPTPAPGIPTSPELAAEDYRFVTQTGTRIEALLRDRFGGLGNGMTELARSIKHRLPPGAFGLVRGFGKLRNRHSHQENGLGAADVAMLRSIARQLLPLLESGTILNPDVPAVDATPVSENQSGEDVHYLKAGVSRIRGLLTERWGIRALYQPARRQGFPVPAPRPRFLQDMLEDVEEAGTMAPDTVAHLRWVSVTYTKTFNDPDYVVDMRELKAGIDDAIEFLLDPGAVLGSVQKVPGNVVRTGEPALRPAQPSRAGRWRTRLLVTAAIIGVPTLLVVINAYTGWEPPGLR